ncbi:hypothetical protein QO239_09605, partial [Cupriavidus taiwanensis]|uniref:hypothetical protein n=1 Tax=Cupriavidus taiwanensis TaxID=164546 RepID=UPI0025403EB5
VGMFGPVAFQSVLATATQGFPADVAQQKASSPMRNSLPMVFPSASRFSAFETAALELAQGSRNTFRTYQQYEICSIHHIHSAAQRSGMQAVCPARGLQAGCLRCAGLTSNTIEHALAFRSSIEFHWDHRTCQRVSRIRFG